jgi:hypothetical protein
VASLERATPQLSMLTRQGVPGDKLFPLRREPTPPAARRSRPTPDRTRSGNGKPR